MTPRRLLSLALPLTVLILPAGESRGGNPGRLSLERAATIPALAVPATETLALKLATRRREVCVDELVSFDLAVLNKSKEPLYVTKPVPYLATLDIVDSADYAVMIYSRSIDCRMIAVPEDLKLLQPGNILTGSLEYVIGCDNERDKAANTATNELISRFHDMSDEKEAAVVFDTSSFNQELFVTKGLGCIAIRRPGTYLFVAELENPFVVTSSRPPRHRSAVGILRSAPLELKVCDCTRALPPAQPN